ncbi:DUF6207 family protein [Streptomyces angustmyceticus]|uniref:DUF6207 family protein n=1 Tax=Streptomyces angustmyceticus TaxID=285578 RepID=UPI0037F7C35C
MGPGPRACRTVPLPEHTIRAPQGAGLVVVDIAAADEETAPQAVAPLSGLMALQRALRPPGARPAGPAAPSAPMPTYAAHP